MFYLLFQVGIEQRSYFPPNIKRVEWLCFDLHTVFPRQRLLNMCQTHQEFVCIHACFFSPWPSCMCAFQRDAAAPCPVQTRRWLCWQPRRQGRLASGTRCAWRPAAWGRKEHSGPRAASNTSPAATRAPLVALTTPEQALREMIMRTKTVT